MGLDVNHRSMNYGRTPLHEAAIYNETENFLKIAELLLGNGAKINARDAKKKTLLFYLIERANLPTVQAFLKFKANFFKHGCS